MTTMTAVAILRDMVAERVRLMQEISLPMNPVIAETWDRRRIEALTLREAIAYIEKACSSAAVEVK